MQYSKKKKANVNKIHESSCDETSDSESDLEVETRAKSLRMNYIKGISTKDHPERTVDMTTQNSGISHVMRSSCPIFPMRIPFTWTSLEILAWWGDVTVVNEFRFLGGGVFLENNARLKCQFWN